MLPYAHVLPHGIAPAFEAAERLSLVATESGELDADVLVLELLRLIYRRDFRAYFDIFPQIVQLLDLDAPSAPMMAALFFLSAVAGDESFATRFPPHAFPEDGGLGTYFRVRDESLDVDDLLAMTKTMPTRNGRATILARASALAATDAPERVEELADRTLELLPEGASGWIGAWLYKASVRVSHGALSEALDCARVVTDQARAVGELSLLAPATALHAIVLWKLGCARDAARVRGAAPRRWSIFFQGERDELDRWLSEEFTESELRALAVEGRALELDELFAIAPAALAASTTS
jgi:hypothetical protein